EPWIASRSADEFGGFKRAATDQVTGTFQCLAAPNGSTALAPTERKTDHDGNARARTPRPQWTKSRITNCSVVDMACSSLEPAHVRRLRTICQTIRTGDSRLGGALHWGGFE